ncbi:hypothetical protein CAEBREN_19537 [Caenorhabditis brenneri]|uniref:CUT domain-containing protein n=1 Tax=Caenorhabditis brenneri TaxID=135651 RepID=G0P030_CAEBE|nr:hypothetical protein CAEBREN_19537 [Caenorhabditis brenneri]
MTRSVRGCDVRVVKELDLKSNGHCPPHQKMATRASTLELPDDFPENFYLEKGKTPRKSVEIELPTAEDFSDFGVDKVVGPYVTPPITPGLPLSFATCNSPSYDPPPMHPDPMQLYFEPPDFSTWTPPPQPPSTFATCSTVTFTTYTPFWQPYTMDPSYQLYQEVPESPGNEEPGPSSSGADTQEGPLWDRKHDWDFITRAKQLETSGHTDDTTEEVQSPKIFPVMKEKPERRPQRMRLSCTGTPREFQPQEYVDFMNTPIPEDPIPDTREIMNNLKQRLSQIEISQAVFAEKILGRSQGTLCDLLKNPKPWAELRCGKETYTRIYNWLRLDEDVGKELCWLPTEEVAKVIGNGIFGKRTRGFYGSSHPYGNPRKPRYRFTEEQRAQLLRFESAPTKTRVKEISREMSIPLESVKNFFKNLKRHRRCL